ncbi:MAG TPA: DUF4190 domain-containing protein [Acidimicrobiales bacterium]|nr:DUF4190 domain-containing protein [Acidimicrobiales bacterium]
MSDVSQGPGWWQASDGKWYSPEQVPGTGAAESAPEPSFPGAGGPPPGSGGPVYPGPIAPPPGPSYGPPSVGGYPYPTAGTSYGYTGVPKNNGLAIAAMVCSFFFWIYGLGAILGIVFGFVARSQIKRSNGTQRGEGMALAGIIIGFAGIVIGIIVVIIVAVAVHHCDQVGNNCTFTTN